jgi:hypothetical protein
MNWNNLYKTGSGGAYVWQGNAGLEQLRQQDFAERKQKQKQLEELSNDFSKVNLDGAKQEDIPDLTKQYDDIRKSLAVIDSTKDRNERIRLKADYSAKKMNLLNSVYNSKQELQKDAELYKIRLTKHDDLSEEFHNDFNTYRSLPSTDPRRKELEERMSQTMWRPKLDEIAFIKGIAPMVTESVTGQVKQSRYGDGVSFDRQDTEKINADKLKKIIIGKATSEKDTRRYIQSKYPDLPIDKAIDAFTEEASGQLSSMIKTTDKHLYTQKDDKTLTNHINKQNWDRANGFDSGGGGGNGSSTPMNIPYANGKATVGFDEYVPISLSKKNFAGSVSIDLKTGKPGKTLPSSNDYEVVGVGNAPIIRGDSKAKKELWGTISQPNFAKQNPDAVQKTPIIHVQIPAKGEFGEAEDYFVPYNRLPENVKNSKQVREALGKFKPASIKPKAQQPKAKVSQKKAINPRDPEELGL